MYRMFCTVHIRIQSFRYLMKSFANAASGEPLTWSVKYLSQDPEAPEFSCTEDFLNLAKLSQACKRRAYW